MTVAEVVKKMVEYSKGDLHDINHFMKVYAYAKTIADCLDPRAFMDDERRKNIGKTAALAFFLLLMPAERVL